MMRIAALNDTSSLSSNEDDVGPSAEVLEAEATRIYHKAISHLAKSEFPEAKELFFEVLNNPYIVKAQWKKGVERSGSLPQDIAIKYSCYKSLGNLYLSEKQYKDSCDMYIKALHLDSTEVTLWQKLGASAIKLKDFQLALIAFQEGLLINPTHWICLDQLLSVLFLLGLYEDCLGLAIQTLHRDPNYIKALAFKDKIFELQPSLINFAKEYFKGSEVLFQDIEYDRAQGDKFIATCLELRPSPKQPRASSPVPSQKVTKTLAKFSWAELGLSLADTYDHLVNEEPKAFVGRLELEWVLDEYVDMKLKEGLKENLKTDLATVFKPGRRLSRSLSYSDEILSSVRQEAVQEVATSTPESNAAADSLPTKGAPPKRRQTIELGEGQESFRIGSRVGGPADPEHLNTIQEEPAATLEEGVHPVGDQTSGPDNAGKPPLPKHEGDKEESKPDSSNPLPPAKEVLETAGPEEGASQRPEEGEDIEEGKATDRGAPEASSHRSEDPETNPGSASASEGELPSGEKQAAVDQLKDLMAMKPPTQILNLSQPGLEYDQDFCEYFDGGVYEEEDEDDDDDDDDEDEEMEVIISENSGSVDGRGQRGHNPSGLYSSQKDRTLDEVVLDGPSWRRPIDLESKLKTQEQRSAAPASDTNAPPLGTPGTMATEEVPKASAPKKAKRAKRGLERELEQLDYWGRRRAREAKKRRRTLTSRLVGVFEESEYLTWAHVIRSFIPAGLLNQDVSGASKQPSDAKPKPKDTLIPASKQPKASGGQAEAASAVEKDDLDPPISDAAWQGTSEDSFKFLKQFSGLLSRSHWTREELNVGEFLHELKSNGGILHVMQRCLDVLLRKHGKVWPRPCALAYKELYQRIRRHAPALATLSEREDRKRLEDFAVAALVHLELLLDLDSAMTAKGPSSSTSDDAPGIDLGKLFEDESSHLEDDLFHLQLLLTRPDVWKERYLQAHLRLSWVQAQVDLLRGLSDEAAFHLERLIDQMTLSARDGEVVKVDACQIAAAAPTDLTPAHFRNQLNVIQRSRMLEKVEAKFASGLYEEVVQILTSTMSNPSARIEIEGPYPPRHFQLLLLVESLVKIGDMKGVIQWGSSSLKEAVEQFQANELNEEERMKWTDVISNLLLLIWDGFSDPSPEGMDGCELHLGRVISSLVTILVIQLEQGASLPQPYFGTLTPWMILHRILARHERRQARKNSAASTESPRPHRHETPDADKVSSPEKGASPAPSTLLLVTAHEELGKNKWCCLEEGRFLLYMLDVLLAEFERSLAGEQKQMLHQSVEQIIFCLFSHPSRKTKYKHLRDHGGQSIPLTWPRALMLYKYYLPSQLPGFQSSQLPSITDDVAVLFRRIISLMPDEYKHPDQIKGINAYIEGESPAFSIVALDFPDDVKDCYYLLADSYFKGKEWEQAIHYYKLDVSVNPNRIDSWAPMGLAKKAQLETLLNSCEVIRNDEEFFKEAQRARRCLDRVLQLDHYFSILWVEKGGLVYMIHSHASRLLKQELSPDMSIEMFEALEKTKSDMLLEASQCFREASKIAEEGLDDDELPDERWLYQYMLGKLAEKTGKSPKEVLGHYLDAFQRLHAIRAKYPMRINYNNPAELSVEALEVFFRINVYIFKYLSQLEGKDIESDVVRRFKGVLLKLDDSPFVQLKEIGDKSNALEDPDDLSPSEEELTKRLLQDPSSSPPKKQKMDEDEKGSIENLVYESVNETLDTFIEKGKKDFENPEVAPVEETEISLGGITQEREDLVLKCVKSFKLCVSRFPHHYKSLYRLAYFYHHSKSHKDNMKARNVLLGCDIWQKLSYMPSSGLFSERRISPMNPKNSNLFNGVWRIPHDEIDRPGSFAAHMYRCVSLCLDILHETKDFYTVLEIATSLRNSPDKDKKYLRDNERELLSEHAAQVGIQTMKDKFRAMFKSSSSPPSKSTCHHFLVDVYKAYKQMSRHLPSSESAFSKMLVDAFATYKGVPKENNPNLLRDAENFCIRNPSSFHNVSSPTGPYPSVVRLNPPAPNMLGMVRRGRPPGHSGFQRFRATHDGSSPTVGQKLAVQQAYKVYENLIQAQTILNNKDLDEKRRQYYRGKYEEYKKEMLNYLQIKSVSHFFHSSLQSLGAASAKLPPPPPSANLNKGPDKSPLPPSKSAIVAIAQTKHTLSSLAAKSKAHGISISAVSRKNEPSTMKPVKPSMSITMSQPKPVLSNSSLESKLSSSSGPKDTKNSTQNSVTITSTLPKLPPGTTLSRPAEPSPSTQKSIPAREPTDPPKSKSLSAIESLPSAAKGSITISQAPAPRGTWVPRKQSAVSFQAAFQASLAKLEVGGLSGKTPAKEIPSSQQSPKHSIKFTPIKHPKPTEIPKENPSKILSSPSQKEDPSKTDKSKSADNDDNCIIILD